MPPPLDDLVVSPELALVDPELAAHARAVLPTQVAPRCVPIASLQDPTPRRHARPRRNLAAPALTLVAIAAASLIVTALTGPERASGESPVAEPEPVRAAAANAVAAPRVGSASTATAQPAPAGALTTDEGMLSRTEPSAAEAVPPGSPASTAIGTRAPTPAPRVAVSARRLVWPRSAAASQFDLELVRGVDVVYAVSVRSSEVVLPRSWKRDGITYRIQPEDQAFVWPVIDGRRSVTPVVDGVLAIDMTPVSRFVEQGRSTAQP